MAYTLDQRREILTSMPWVAHSPRGWPNRCQGYLTDMPMYAWREARKPEAAYDAALDKWRCHKRANWVHLGLDGEIHTYCWHHLFIYGLESNREENERYQAWLDRYMETHPDPPDWNDEEPDMPLSRH